MGIQKGIQQTATVLVILLIIASCQPQSGSGIYETYLVDKGNIETWETTEGRVEPANEVLLLSPTASIIGEIKKEPGQKVKEGEVIVVLNTIAVESKIEQLNDQLAVKQNNLEKTRLNARSTKADLSHSIETKKLKISSIKSVMADQEQLLEVGGISQAKFDKTKQELVLAQKELQLVQQKNSIRLQQLATDEKGLLLQIEIQEKELEQQKDLLGRMQVKAPSDGIILGIHGKTGEKIQGDKLLVSLSDLTRFKIKATISAKHKNMIKTGRRAYVVVDNTRLSGRIGTIMPKLEDGNLQFTVSLTDNNHPKLIPNQRVDLQVVKRARYDVLRLKKGAMISNKKVQHVYVVNGDSAEQTELTLGLVTDDFIEIKGGLKAGDEVVISTVSTIENTSSVSIDKFKK
ncbi:efflux RND transporter periplasmic adaptor subunit [Carboxylicivirga sp. M1479]|uniref:efflux RND transporter periplasmic adaptor subunit n=1 Tax=Carboxylicivirga sp. M1479 TaxID=2594476 RepID=UPI001177E7B1|nr:efflux RND transporter periplasmic adaptor subunit [Carboxylicivirga sp. M1479]TRX72362.1 HlyD family efflux transporter periplasmic adaptor subunit [Carboxylicivirga sp. M1479]